jgi:sulfide dehydrogenase [flavocytochrome c] flavoprotein subunit
MFNPARRRFIKLVGGSSAVIAASGFLNTCGRGPAEARVVIIGGGFGGSTCAKYLRRLDCNIEITLVEPSTRYITCPFSNTVIGGLQPMESITLDYSKHEKRRVKIIHATAQDIDAVSKKVVLDNGETLEYDYLVLAPGIDFKWEEVEGMEASDAGIIPHAWKAGQQTRLLKSQLAAMPDGGVVIIAPPANPFRCPPGPYERISLVAHYLRQHKPKSKILVLDAKDSFSKQALFTRAWQQLYPGMIEWIGGSDGGRIDEIDVKSRTLYSELGDKHKGDVVNFIPPQKAGSLVHRAGLTNADGWCFVDQRSFESTLQKDIYIIGDACVAGKMPKSGFAANSQGKVCAAAVMSSINGLAMPDPSYVNTCYSLVAPDYGISVAAVYRYSEEQGIYKSGGGVSPLDVDPGYRTQEAIYARGWYQSITQDSFG